MGSSVDVVIDDDDGMNDVPVLPNDDDLDFVWLSGDLREQMRDSARSYEDDLLSWGIGGQQQQHQHQEQQHHQQQQQQELQKQQRLSDHYLAAALRDIDRRHSSDLPCWVIRDKDRNNGRLEDNNNSWNDNDINRRNKERNEIGIGIGIGEGVDNSSELGIQTEITAAIGGGHVFGSIVATVGAPISTALVVIALLLPGITTSFHEL